MKNFQKMFWPYLITVFFLIMSGCQGNSESSNPGSSSDVTVGVQTDLTAVHSQSLVSSSRNTASAPSFSVSGVIGTMQVTDTSDSSVTNHDWPIAYDDVAFTLTSSKTIVLSPGVYDFAFLVTINNHQYAGSTSAVVIADGTGTDIPMTVNAVIGDTDITVAVVSELPEFKFSYSAAELSSLTAPKIGITVDSGSETVLDLNPTTGISNQYVSLSTGAHTIELKLYDGAVQVGKSVQASQKGYEYSTVQDIAREANVANGGIYAYFANKEDLLYSVIDYGFKESNIKEGLNEHLQSLQITQDSQTPIELIQRFIRRNFFIGVIQPDLAKLHVMHGIYSSGFYSSAAFTAFDRYIESIFPVLEEGKANGSIRPKVNNRVFMNMIIGTYSLTNMRWQLTEHPTDIDKPNEINEMVAMLTRSIFQES